MASDQTALDVLVAHQRQDISSCLCGWSELGQSFCQHQKAALDAAGFAIVRKPTGAAVEAACEAYDDLDLVHDYRAHPEQMAAALAAAAAADGRTPDDANVTGAAVPAIDLTTQRGLTYDPQADAAYIQLSGKPVASTREGVATVNHDLAEDGSLIGVELLDVSKAVQSTPDILDETRIAETLRVAAESAYQQEGGYWIEGYTDDLAHAVVAALRGDTDG